MNKKQVGAFLKVMGKDESRPVLMRAKIDTLNDKPVLVATNGYVISAVYLDEDAMELVGKHIRREALEKWHKLATGKSRLTGNELQDVLGDDYAQHGSYLESNYINWKNAMPAGEPEAQVDMKFNADLFKIVQDLDGEGALHVKFYGKLAPMVFESDNGYYLIMPMKG